LNGRDAISLWIHGELPRTLLYRALLAQPFLRVPTHEAKPDRGSPTVVELDGKSILYVFTDDTAASEAARAGRFLTDQVLTSAPLWRLWGTLEGVDLLVINPESPERVDIPSDDFGLLRELSEVASVEESLLGLGARRDVLSLLGGYSRFRLVFEDQGAMAGVPLAPDVQGRRLLPVFTAADTAAAWVDRLGSQSSLTWRVAVVPGRLVFTKALEMEVDGLVFNCAGPLEPAAFGRGLAEQVLQTLGT
jgi:hypothetical protein